MFFYYELKCTDSTGFYFYYYFYCNKPIRSIKTALNSGYAPDKLRLLIDDTYKTPVSVRRLSLFEYLYLKKFKRHFYLGWREKWEKKF